MTLDEFKTMLKNFETEDENCNSDAGIAENLHITFRDVQMLYYLKKVYKDNVEVMLEKWNEEHKS